LLQPKDRDYIKPASHHDDVADSPCLTETKTWDYPDSNWNLAASQSPQVDPFCCRTEWQLSFHEAMGPDRQLLVREAPGSLVAFAEQKRPDGAVVFTPVESHWLFGCPLLGPDAIALLEQLAGEHEPQAGMPAPLFVISGLIPRGELFQKMYRRLAPRFDFFEHRDDVLCSASLAGGLDGFLSRRSAKHRRGLAKQARRATREGVTFERHAPTDTADAAAVYARMLAVEESSWKGIGECGMSTGLSRSYYDCMMRRLSASGRGRVIFARHAERDIGYIFGSRAGEHYRGQQFSYADDWKAYSIGNLLQVEQIKWLCEEQVLSYDMGPMMDYKRHWTEQRLPIKTVIMRSR